MAIEDVQTSQSVADDGGMGGPGAPIPLSTLEVSDLCSASFKGSTYHQN
jgi:hypothetical protein